MKKIVLICLLIFAAVSADEKDSVIIHLTPCEEVLAGVILLEERSGISPEKQSELYSELLEFSNVSHEEFKSYLNEYRTDPEKWFQVMERISSAKK